MAFLVAILGTFFLAKFCNLTNLMVLILNMTIVFFQILARNTQYKICIVPSLGVLFFREILQLDKFEGVDFKYDNRF